MPTQVQATNLALSHLLGDVDSGAAVNYGASSFIERSVHNAPVSVGGSVANHLGDFLDFVGVDLRYAPTGRLIGGTITDIIVTEANHTELAHISGHWAGATIGTDLWHRDLGAFQAALHGHTLTVEPALDHLAAFNVLL